MNLNLRASIYSDKHELAELPGPGVGRAMAQAAVDFAKAAGYRTIFLDTLPAMATAQTLYRQLGFREVRPFRYNPVPGTTFMVLTFGSGRPPTRGTRRFVARASRGCANVPRDRRRSGESG